MPSRSARWMGIDITTTEMALAVSDGETDGFASLKMRGATHWLEDPACPAFELRPVAEMFLELLQSLGGDGWQFDQGGSLSVACRQHDMVVLDSHRVPLMPALSWQCNAARAEVEELNANSLIVESVGRVEERFILPKLLFALRRKPDLAQQIGSVMTTGDWVLGMLASCFRLSTSDALSNGLLDQRTRVLASDAIRQAGLDVDWFPEVVQSGYEAGQVQIGTVRSPWQEICRKLAGWQVVAGLGDNHASGLGCGMRDNKTLVVSAGTSGTVNLACPAESEFMSVPSPSARFEFYRDQTLLLRMLAFCGDWYNRFIGEFCPELDGNHSELNRLASQVSRSEIQRVRCDDQGEHYDWSWRELGRDIQIASVQYSIAMELLQHVRAIFAELPTSRSHLTTYVLTGGLSQSPFFQQVFSTGIRSLDPGKRVHLSGRTGPLRYKTSASGALLNARMPEWQYDLANMPPNLFPLADCQSTDGAEWMAMVERGWRG